MSMLSLKELDLADALVEKGLVIKDDWNAYTAKNWEEIDFEYQYKAVLLYIINKNNKKGNWNSSAEELALKVFNNELSLVEVNAICKFLIDEDAVVSNSTKEGVSIGCTEKTILYTNQANSTVAPSSYPYHKPMAAKNMRLESNGKEDSFLSKTIWQFVIPTIGAIIAGLILFRYFGIGG